MEDLNPLDEAQLRHEFRDMYKDLGHAEAMQVLYELLISANILCEVLLEESKKELES